MELSSCMTTGIMAQRLSLEDVVLGVVDDSASYSDFSDDFSDDDEDIGLEYDDNIEEVEQDSENDVSGPCDMELDCYLEDSDLVDDERELLEQIQEKKGKKKTKNLWKKIESGK